MGLLSESINQVFPNQFHASSQTAYYIPKNTVSAKGQLAKAVQDVSLGYESFYKKYWYFIAQMLYRKFAQVAAKYTPPNIGKAYIDQKYYSRPYYKIEDLAKGLIRTSRGKRLYATKEDFAALRNGFKFKIMNTKQGVKRGTVYAYAKGINEAKRLARIQNRGLSKYSWGSIINSFIGRVVYRANETNLSAKKLASYHWYNPKRGLYEVGLPAIFRRLQRKSPNIKKYKWGFVDYSQDANHRLQFTLVNTLANIQRYGNIAIRRGTDAMQKEFNRLKKAIQDQNVKALDKLFNFDLSKVTQIEKFTIKNKKKG